MQRDDWPGELTDPSSLVNKYIYCGNNPLNWIDPYGWDKQKKDKPWWEKLEEGYYYGTGFGQEALDWYAQRWSETGNPLWAVPGFFAAPWTPETYQATAAVLLTAYSLSGWAARTGAQYTIRVGRYPSTGGGGINLYREGRRIFGIDWHQWGTTTKNIITKSHIYVRNIGRHLPWKWLGIR